MDRELCASIGVCTSCVHHLKLIHALRSSFVSMLSPTARKFDYVFDSFLTAAGEFINPKSIYFIRIYFIRTSRLTFAKF